MHSVLDNDKNTVDKGKVIEEAINQGVGSFTPDLMYEQLVKNYANAEHIYGKKLIRALTGYDPNYIDRNIQIPEFQRELKKKIEEGIEKLKQDKLITKDGIVTDKGTQLASLIMYTEELDNIIPKGGLGERFHKKSYIYGDKTDDRQYKKGDSYKNLAIKKSTKLALRRGHKKLEVQDLKVFERESKGEAYIVYAMDTSGSMRGKKIQTAKKAGIALAYKAIDNKDKVGLIVFNSEIESTILPTKDFSKLLFEMSNARASMETNIVDVIKKAVEMFPDAGNLTKHLILLTDALPTVGKEPVKDTMDAVAEASAAGITISLIGIALDRKGKELAKKMIEISDGRLYMVTNLEELDQVILEDYSEVM